MTENNLLVGASISRERLRAGLQKGSLTKGAKTKQLDTAWMCQCCQEFGDYSTVVQEQEGDQKGKYYRICDVCLK